MHFMHKFLTFIKEFNIPKKRELMEAVASFSRKELFIFITIIIIAIISTIIILNNINSQFMVSVPTNGGTLTEGIVGMPTLVNPVLALSDADKAMTSIVYSGLMRKLANGNFIPDLAKSYSVSKDRLTYTFILKKGARFQDGKEITADDVVFTIDKIKDPQIKSPRRNGWEGITVTKKNKLTVVFTLNRPYISFMDNIIIGILPLHIWKNVSIPEFSLSPLNIKALGSGPYKIESVIRNKNGFPQQYILKRFKDFTLGVPHIKYLKIVSFANENDLIKAMLSHSIDQAGGISPDNAEKLIKAGYIIHATTLPRTFGLFFNVKNNGILAEPNIISALDKAINREIIVDKVLDGYGTIIHNPIPEIMLPQNKIPAVYKTAHLIEAENILKNDGWSLGKDGILIKGGITTKIQTKKVRGKIVTKKIKVDKGPVVKFIFSLSTGNTPELKHAAELIKSQLKMIGVQVNIKIYETGQLNQLIRSRNYESLFFGQVMNHESDLYSFWHSSQRSDPGLNIAMYNDKKIDTILESIQKTYNREDRIKEYKDFVSEFNKNLPALLVYSPKYLYATSQKLNNIYLDSLITSSDRFSSIYKWYANQERVWKIFSK